MVKQLTNWLSNVRVDVPDMKGLEQSSLYDFASLLKSLIGSNSTYILKGFSIASAPALINALATTTQIVVDNSVIWIPNDANGSYLVIDPGTANEILDSSINDKVVGSFTASATNYISVRFSRKTDPGTTDLVAIWDIDSKTEFVKSVPKGLVLNYEFVINTTGFGNNTPLAIIDVNSSGNITKITNAKTNLFRLGSGGLTPDPNHSWSYSVSPENPLSITSGSAADPFAGGDFELGSLKDWMDAVMTELKSVKGSAYWYGQNSNVNNLNLANTWFDSVGSVITGSGTFIHAGAGALSWTSDLNLRSIIGPLSYTVLAGSVALNDGDIAYVTLSRDVDFQASNTFTFNGTTTVTASLNISGINAGDWIKLSIHGINAYRKVQSVSGTNITLTSAYPLSGSGKALKDVGSYTVSSAAPTAIPNNANVYWLAKRDDNGFASFAITDASRTSNVATIAIGAHSLVVGQYVNISGVSDSSINGTYIIDSVTLNTISYSNDGADVASLGAGGSASSIAKIYLHGLGLLEQGAQTPVDGSNIQNLLDYTGSPDVAQTSPNYNSATTGSLPLFNYNSSGGENLTARLSKVTAMIGSHKQDSNIIVDPGVISWNGTNITITGAKLSIAGATVGTAPILVNTYSAALPDGSCCYLDFSRSSGSTLTIAQATLLSLTPQEQRLIIARNVGGDIYV